LSPFCCDPDGNGLEFYWDRSLESCSSTPEESVAMGAEHPDLDGLRREGPVGPVRPGALP